MFEKYWNKHNGIETETVICQRCRKKSICSSKKI